MAGEITRRTWYLLVRREGFDAQRFKIPIALKQVGREFDGLVDAIPTNDDLDLIDDATILPSADRALVGEYEFYAITAPWEANELI